MGWAMRVRQAGAGCVVRVWQGSWPLGLTYTIALRDCAYSWLSRCCFGCESVAWPQARIDRGRISCRAAEGAAPDEAKEHSSQHVVGLEIGFRY